MTTPPPSEEQVEAARGVIMAGYTISALATLLAEREAAAFRRGAERMQARIFYQLNAESETHRAAEVVRRMDADKQ